MSQLQPTDIIHGEVVRISNSGNGILDYGGGEISVGPVRPGAVGQSIDAVVYDEDHAFCLTESARTQFYDNAMKAQTGQLLNSPPAACPGLGDTIEVDIEGVNSSRHGPASYRGIPVRAQNIPEGITAGDSLSVKVTRLEPSRVVATGLTNMRIRSRLPEVGDRFEAVLSRRTNSGNGLVESFADYSINIGPVQAGTLGESVEVVLLSEDWGYCLTNSVVTDGYDESMAPHIPDDSRVTLEELREMRITNSRQGSNVGRVVRGNEPRKGSFRDRIVAAYEGACAVCGQRLQDAQGEYFEVEAAHIYPVSGVDPGDAEEGGPDSIKNGLALCRTHHWTFDRGWFTIEDDYTITIRDNPSIAGYEQLKPYNGERLLLPDNQSDWPARYYLEAHREKVWNR